MLIYSNNLAEKLFGYAISRDYLKYSSPFCDLLEDPNLKIDFDLAINFTKGINGDFNAVKTFTEDFIINAPSLDITTVNFYVKKMYQYPIFQGEIQRVNYVLGNVNRIRSDDTYNFGFARRLKDALKDCLNSPCNYFAENSNSVARLAESTANQNTTTVPPFTELFGEFTTAIGGMGKDLFNKIPKAFQNSVAELAAIGQSAFTEAVNMFVKDDKDDLISKARRGVSLRSGETAGGYIYTPDFKSFIDHNQASSNILGAVSRQMGDCFRQYQQSYRYNPYDPEMNLDTSNKQLLGDQANGKVYERDLTGPQGTTGGLGFDNNTSLGFAPSFKKKNESYDSDYESPPTVETGASTGDVYYEFTVGSKSNRVTTFGGWYDIEDTTSPSGVSVWGDTYYATLADGNTLAGIGIYGTKFIYCPSQPGTINKTELGKRTGFVKYINDGYINNERYDQLDSSKFNNGVALKLADIRKYLTPRGIKASDCVVELSYKGKTLKNVNVVDVGGLHPDARIDVTPFIAYELTGNRPIAKVAGTATLSDGTKVTIKNISSLKDSLQGMTVKVMKKGAVSSSSKGNSNKFCDDSLSNINELLKLTEDSLKLLKLFETGSGYEVPDTIPSLVEFIKASRDIYNKSNSPEESNVKTVAYSNGLRASANATRIAGEELKQLGEYAITAEDLKTRLREQGEKLIKIGNKLKELDITCPKLAQARAALGITD